MLSTHGIRQIRLAESEKERFVTFYFNGQREMPFIGEDRHIIPSLKIATYDRAPYMRTREITQALVDKLHENVYDVYIVNFASPDMVGHTGNIEATIKAVKVVDECLAKIVQESENLGYNMLITADHGNAEQKINPVTGEISTEHTDNPVPFILVERRRSAAKLRQRGGKLGDVAPTILHLMGTKRPVAMTGRSLI